MNDLPEGGTRIIYAARISCYGLLTPKPVKCSISERFPDFWCGNDGNFVVEFQDYGYRINRDGPYITYSDTSEEKVDIFIQGIKSALEISFEWAKTCRQTFFPCDQCDGKDISCADCQGSGQLVSTQLSGPDPEWPRKEKQ